MTIPEIDTATALMLVGCSIASMTDATTGKILNVLTGPLVVAGLIVNAMAGSWEIGVWGFVLATQIHLPLYFAKIEKGGDVKLLMGIGACMGPTFILNTSFWYAVLYLVIGPLVLLYRKRVKNLLVVGIHLANKAKGGPGSEDSADAPQTTTLWTAPVIFGAALAAWISTYPAGTSLEIGTRWGQVLTVIYVIGWVLYKVIRGKVPQKS